MMRSYKFTWIGLGVAILVGILSYIVDLDPFDRLVTFFNSVEQYEIDELFIAVIIFLVFLSIDLIIHQRNQKIEEEKIKVYKAMISSAHHILNNFLNQMQLFKMTAQNTPDFDRGILSLYDTIIQEATSQIQALSSITEISETTIQESVMPQAQSNAEEIDYNVNS